MATVIDKAKDLLQGIFTADEPMKEAITINTPDQQNLYETIMTDYTVFKASRQQIEPFWQEEQRFYMGNHWYGLRSDHVSRMRPNSVDNVSWAQIESIVGKLTGWDPWPDFSSQEPSDEQKAKDLNDVMPYELAKIKFKQNYIRAIRTMVIHGPLVFKTIYNPNVEGGRGLHRYEGQNEIIPVELGTFFIDPRITDFLRLQEMGAIIINTRKTLEYFAENWPGQGEKVQSDMNAADTQIYNYPNYGQQQRTFSFTESTFPYDANTQEKTAGLIEYWYRGLPKMVSPDDKKLFKELALDLLEEGKDPSEAIAKSDGTTDGVHCVYVSTSGVFLEHKSYVYDHGQYPFTARTLFPDERNAWGKGFMRDMIKPQIMLNKYTEIAIETMAKSGNSALVYEEGAIERPATWKEQRSTEGALLPIAQGRMQDWKELQGVNVPSTVFQMIEYYLNILQKIPGQFDSANGQASPNVTSGEQAKSLMAAASTRLNTVTDMISESLQDVFTQYIELMAQFYTNERIARVNGREVSIGRASLISSVPADYSTGEMVPHPETGEMQPEVLNLQEEYVPCFDIKVNITAEKPTDQQYWIQMAFQMLGTMDPITQLPMIDAQGVWYAVNNGRVEPYDTIEQRIEQKAGLQQQMMQMQQQMMQLQQENEGIKQQFAQTNAEKDQQEQQKTSFDQTIQQQKMDNETAKTMNDIMVSQQQPVGP